MKIFRITLVKILVTIISAHASAACFRLLPKQNSSVLDKICVSKNGNVDLFKRQNLVSSFVVTVKFQQAHQGYSQGLAEGHRFQVGDAFLYSNWPEGPNERPPFSLMATIPVEPNPLGTSTGCYGLLQQSYPYLKYCFDPGSPIDR